MKVQLAKGVRDINPEDQILREGIIEKLKEIFKRYGFNPLDTPIIERYETLSAKGGEEILKEIFNLKDQGGRNLGLRFDLTVPFARYVGINPQMKFPFKRYQIGKVFRDGPIKLGRYREFIQCDVDVVGTNSMMADAECLLLARDFFDLIGMNVVLKVNNRKILDGIMESLKIKKNLRDSVMLSLDKLEKLGLNAVKKELKEKGLDSRVIDSLVKVISVQGDNKAKMDLVRGIIGNNEGFEEVREVLFYVEDAEFDPSLARGLSYYTGTVFEIFLRNSEIKSSIAAGGRYDKIIGYFLGAEYPAVGISFGLDVITEALKLEKKRVKRSVVKVYVIPVGTRKESFELVKGLREKGVNTDIDLVGRSISKNLDFANKLGIPYVVFVGEEELKKKKYKLKDMEKGIEEDLSEKQLIKFLKNV